MWLRRALLGCATGAALLAVALAVFLMSSTGQRLRDGVSRVLETDEGLDHPLASADDVLRYLQQHPDRYALAMWDVGDEDAGVFHDADTAWPLASTVKIVPLMLASERVADGRWSLDTPTPEVERFYLPGSDGNAHPEALRADGGTSTLGATIHAMVRFSDNAATDALLFRLGREAFGDQPLHPLTGTLLLARSFDGGSIDDAAWAAAARLDAGTVVTLPFIADQEAMTRRFDNRGTARDFARLMERIYAADDPRYALARQELQWPMQFKSNQADFVVLATKGGSLPGTLTAAYYVETRAHRRRVMALFLHDLPFATWAELSRSFAQQKLERALLLEADSPDL